MITRRAIFGLLAVPALLPVSSVAGAWAEGSFANDGALDWVLVFAKEPSRALVRRTLDRALAGEYIDSMDGQAAIAAAEVIAASLNRPAPDFPPEIRSATERLKAELAPLAALAKRAVSQVAGPKSELRELWGERQESLTRWQVSINGLLTRLSANAA